MSVQIRTLMAGDIQYVAANMRAADREEIFAANGWVDAFGRVDTLKTLSRAVMRSSHYWVAASGDEPVAIFGVAPLSLLGGSGSPWLLGTERVFAERGALVREGRRYLERMREVYQHLVNYVDARNERSVRWLKRLGFRIHSPVPYGVAQLPFHRFEMGR